MSHMACVRPYGTSGVITLIRQQGAASISLYGVSLGTYAVSLLAGLVQGIDGVVAGVPVSDSHLSHRRGPRPARSIEREIMGGPAREALPRGVAAVPRGQYQGRPVHLRRLWRPAGPSGSGLLGRSLGSARISWYSGAAHMQQVTRLPRQLAA